MVPMLKSALAAMAALISSVMLSSPTPPSSSTAPVSQVEWKAMLAGAKAGGVINLGKRRVDFARQVFQPSAPVTIRGGTFNAVVLDAWHNVTFEGTRFEGTPDMVDFLNIVVANKPENLFFRNCYFTGATRDGQYIVRGPSLREGRNVGIEHSLFERMAGFTNFVRSDGVRFADNDMREIREGLDIVGGRNIIIERNRFQDFRGVGNDHPDGIQFFTGGLTRPDDIAARDVVVRNNLIDAAGKAQGIFLRDELNLAESGRGYQRFLIEDNIVISAGWHGITVQQIEDATIRNNRLFRVRGVDTMDSRLSLVDGTGTVSGNEANAYILRGKVKEGRNKQQTDSPRSQIDAVIAEWVTQFRKG